MTPQAAHVAQRIRELASQLNANKPAPRPSNAITAKQLSYLTVLIGRHGKEAYQLAKIELEIEASLSRMTKAEAWQLINYLTTEDPI